MVNGGGAYTIMELFKVEILFIHLRDIQRAFWLPRRDEVPKTPWLRHFIRFLEWIGDNYI